MGGRKKYVSIAQGWSGDYRKEVEGIQLPDKIICSICKHHRPRESYSQGQLIALRNLVSSRGRDALRKQAVAKCAHCSCSSSVERVCFRCRHYRSIDEFSRSQRASENPICQPCADYEEAQHLLQLTEARENEGGGDDGTSVTSRGLIEDTESTENEDAAVVLHGECNLAAPSSVPTHPNPRKFAKIKAHRPSKEECRVVPRPEYGDLDCGVGSSDVNAAEYL